MAAENKECNEALLRIAPQISLDKIYAFVDDVPYISKLQKEFYRTYITARYEKMIKPAFKKIFE